MAAVAMAGRLRPAIVMFVLAMVPAIASAGPVPCDLDQTSDRCPLWESHLDLSGDWSDLANAMALSPDGGTVYVTGESNSDVSSGSTWSDYATVAIDSQTGQHRWVSRYDGPAAGGIEAAFGVATTPGGGIVLVTGGDSSPSGQSDTATVALQAATGSELWHTRWDGGRGTDYGTAVVAGPDPHPQRDGDLAYVSSFAGDFPDPDAAIHAYDAETGEPRWELIYTGTGQGWDRPVALRLSPGGARLYVGAFSEGQGLDYAVVAIDTLTGGMVWEARYDGPAHGEDELHDLALSPDGTVVAVTGSSADATGHTNYATVAYRADTGDQLWAARHVGTGPPPPLPDRVQESFFTGVTVKLSSPGDVGRGIAFAPNGGRIYVTGAGRSFPNADDFVTVAYDTADGRVAWTAPYDGPMHRFDVAEDVAVSPDGTRVYVTGNSSNTGVRQSDFSTTTWGYAVDDYATVAYDAASGDQLWAARHDGPGAYSDFAEFLEVTASGRVVVGGNMSFKDVPAVGVNSLHYGVVAYAP
jgi:DNA-binding beta-propeller fold protein YncE